MKASVKRTEILKCATNLFNHYGFKAVGIDRIIDESKIAKMTMYHHFSSKDEIILEVLEGFKLTLWQDMLAPIDAKDWPAEKKIRELVKAYGRWFESKDFYGCPFHKAMAEFPDKDHPVQIKVQEHHDLLLNFLVKTVKSKSLASQILLVLEGAAVKAKIHHNAASAKEAWTIISHLMKA